MRGKEYRKILAVLAVITVTSSIGVSYKVSAANVQTVTEGSSNEVSLPASYQSKTTEIKNQEINGVCWSFAGMATLENYLLKNNMGSFDFSEEYIKWMALEGKDKPSGWIIERGNGAPTQTVPGMLISGVGPVLESDVSYDANNKSSKPSNLYDLKPQFDVSEIQYVSNNKDEVKKAVMDNGAVESCYYHDLDGKYISSDNTSYYCNVKMGTNHAISIVGWDDNYSKDKFSEDCKPKDDGAWLIKNSSGTKAGDNGYEWISYEDVNLLDTSTNNLNYTIKKASKHNDNRKLYQYDEYGVVSECTVAQANELNEITYANVYDFNEEDKILDSVIFESNNIGNDYSVYYVPVELDEKDNKDVLKMDKKVLLSSGKTEFNGYISVPANSFDLPSGKGAIAIEVKGKDSNIGIGIEGKVNIGGVSSLNVSYEEGQSYVVVGDQAYDLNKDLAPIAAGNLCIKAVTLTEPIKEEQKPAEGDDNQATGTPSNPGSTTPEGGTDQKPGDNEDNNKEEENKPGTGSPSEDKEEQKPGEEQKPEGETKPEDTTKPTGDMSNVGAFGLIAGAFGAFVALIKKEKQK